MLQVSKAIVGNAAPSDCRGRRESVFQIRTLENSWSRGAIGAK
jgi:hypothetical protein